MSRNIFRDKEEELDEILKAALADDLPDTAAAGMRNRIAAFRARTDAKKEHPAAVPWFFRKGLWAALAIGMLVAGFLLQGLQVPSPLADKIAYVKIEITSPKPDRPADLHSKTPLIVPKNIPASIPGEKEA